MQRTVKQLKEALKIVVEAEDDVLASLQYACEFEERSIADRLANASQMLEDIIDEMEEVMNGD